MSVLPDLSQRESRCRLKSAGPEIDWDVEGGVGGGLAMQFSSE